MAQVKQFMYCAVNMLPASPCFAAQAWQTHDCEDSIPKELGLAPLMADPSPRAAQGQPPWHLPSPGTRLQASTEADPAGLHHCTALGLQGSVTGRKHICGGSTGPGVSVESVSNMLGFGWRVQLCLPPMLQQFVMLQATLLYQPTTLWFVV